MQSPQLHRCPPKGPPSAAAKHCYLIGSRGLGPQEMAPAPYQISVQGFTLPVLV